MITIWNLGDVLMWHDTSIGKETTSIASKAQEGWNWFCWIKSVIRKLSI